MNEDITFETGRIHYKGKHLDGIFTKKMALEIKAEAEGIINFFDRTKSLLKNSMEVLDVRDSRGTG